MRAMRLDPDALSVHTFETQLVVVANSYSGGAVETCWNSCVFFCASDNMCR